MDPNNDDFFAADLFSLPQDMDQNNFNSFNLITPDYTMNNDTIDNILHNASSITHDTTLPTPITQDITLPTPNYCTGELNYDELEANIRKIISSKI